MPRTFFYGPAQEQVGDLHLPKISGRGVVCLLHGGFWRTPYNRAEMADVAHHLVKQGYVVWNLEYRRVGDREGGWPGTFQDIAAGIDHLATLAQDDVPLNLDNVVVVGHSSGGHLALWSARRTCTGDVVLPPTRVKVTAVVGLAPVADLVRGHGLAVGRSAVAEVLDGSPDEQPERYGATSPSLMLPLGVPQLLVHGGADDVVPIEMTRSYVRQAVAAGDEVELVELDGVGHMDFLDPTSAAQAVLCEWLDRIQSRGDARTARSPGGPT